MVIDARQVLAEQLPPLAAEGRPDPAEDLLPRPSDALLPDDRAALERETAAEAAFVAEWDRRDFWRPIEGASAGCRELMGCEFRHRESGEVLGLSAWCDRLDAVLAAVAAGPAFPA